MSSFCRRDFIKLGGAAGLAALGPRIALAATPGQPRSRDTLVVIFLRGALDGLSAVVPHADSNYYALRPQLAVPPPGQAGGALDLDGRFGLHPALAPLLPFWQRGELGIVNAVGLATPSRSHFDAQDFMERAWMAQGGPGTGWLNRHLVATAAAEDSTFRALALGKTVQRSLAGEAPVIGLDSIAGFGVRSSSTRAPAALDVLESSFGSTAFIESTARQAFGAIDALAASGAADLAVENGAQYGNNTLGTQLADVARLVKSGVGVEAAAIDVGGWDTHDAQNNRLPPLLATLATNMAAFATDLGSRMADVTVITMTEFGRRAVPNASGGTDHGRGSAMFLLGSGVLGKQVHGMFPGLASSQLENGDLAVTTDYRAVLAELLQQRLHSSAFDVIFPGWEGTPTRGMFMPR